jgi:hypothetical protein
MAKKTEVRIISRQQMLDAVKENFDRRDKEVARRKSFAAWGLSKCRDRAVDLYNALLGSYVPSARKVAAYFGPGARMVNTEKTFAFSSETAIEIFEDGFTKNGMITDDDMEELLDFDDGGWYSDGNDLISATAWWDDILDGPAVEAAIQSDLGNLFEASWYTGPDWMEGFLADCRRLGLDMSEYKAELANCDPDDDLEFDYELIRDSLIDGNPYIDHWVGFSSKDILIIIWKYHQP